MKTQLFIVASLMMISACSTSPPKNSSDICAIFREKDDWYDATKEAYQQWGVPIHVQMAIMQQESRFVADAQPPRPWLLGIIPWFRSSSAYGYAQAQDGTWEDYLNNGGKWSADRDDFADSSDFIGWYCAVSQQRLGISKWDTRNLYLAYHEGHGGYQRKSYLQKKWLLNTANKVAHKAKQYHSQLTGCKEELESKGWFFW
ncbi:transglycosylase SLT domain-containing protein [Methylomarinum sp. Ch1-1]|uniref:Transglycosylase SLT domain-containing protein n=1 Tax=Methylomarinum roseum TaxID=3067653 RepID=A0AAU7NXY6_9GAMM